MEQSVIFRIAMLLYSESSGIKKKDTVLKKVIESVFVALDNKPLTYSEIENFVKELYEIYLLSSEIEEIIENRKNKVFEKTVEDKKVKIHLSDKRYSLLKNFSQKSIIEYIDEYITVFELHTDVKEEILEYLYELFQRNIVDFKAVITGENVITEETGFKLTVESAEHINGFFQWENADKNKSLLALQGASLEYSMLTCNSNVLFGTRLGDIFSNKKLYIDTNIIYYCLGINGEDYKNANETLLNRCIASNERLRITRYTEEEFYNTLDHYIDEIKKYDSKAISQLKYRKYMHNQDVYLFYLDWKKTKKTFSSPDYFRKYLQTEYASWKQNYKIYVETKEPYDAQKEENLNTLEQYSQAFDYHGKINYDAYNIFWVEQKRIRKTETRDFANTDYFILSPHKLIKRWDSGRQNAVPVIVTPNMWLILLNRFISRSKNDYECFKSFINIKVPVEEPIDNREFMSIVKAVEDVTSDLQQQESIIDEFVAQKFAYLGRKENEELSPEDIHEKTKQQASKMLEEQMQGLQKQVNEMAVTVEQTQVSMEQYQRQIEGKDDSLNEIKNKNSRMSDRHIALVLNQKRCAHGVIMVIITGLLAWQLIDLFLLKNQNNLLCNLVINMVKGTPLEDSVSDILLWLIPLLVTLVVTVADVKLSKIFIDREYIDMYKKSARKKFEGE